MWQHQIEPLAALGRVRGVRRAGARQERGAAALHARGQRRRAARRVRRAARSTAPSSWACRGAACSGCAWRCSTRRASRRWPCSTRAPSRRTCARAVKYRLFVSFARRFGMPPALVDAQLAPLFFCERTLRERPELVERFVRAANGFPREGTARAALAVVVHRKDILPRIGAHPRAHARRVRARGPRHRAGALRAHRRGASPGRASCGSRTPAHLSRARAAAGGERRCWCRSCASAL